MPAPASVPELLDLVHKSGVADEGKLQAYLKRVAEQGGAPTEPVKYAQMLVRDGLLTYFQAEQLLQGKWKRFTIGKYKVLEKLGSGGMAQVFLCEHKLMRRRVAVKVLPIPKAQDKSSLDRFYREARAVAAVDHPNIVRAYDIDQDDNLHFIVMEYVDGTNLQDLVKKFGPLDITRACHYIYGSAIGLQHAHEMSLIHRDIKPGNILIDRSGVVKLLDLGLARLINDDDDNITRQNDENVLGTADYLAPEQALDSHTVDIRADIYSLGATFYFLLTGSAPFPEGSVAQKLIWHQSREPQPLEKLRPEVPAELAAIVRKMMAKDPANRYQTPAELLTALAPWVTVPIPPPDDRELPQLSPAASGVSVPSLIARTGPVTPGSFARAPGSGAPIASVPSAIAPTSWAGGSGPGGVSTAPAPAATVETTGDIGVWASLGNETQPITESVTSRSGTAARVGTDGTAHENLLSPRRRSRSPVKLLLLVVALAVVGGGAFGAWYKFLRKTDAEPTPEPTPGPRRLLVSKSGTEGTYATIAQALKQAQPGDIIAITDERLAEPMTRLHRVKDLTIESGLPDGKPVLIEFAPGAGPLGFDVLNADNLRIRNLEYDGKGICEVGVTISGVCPGLTLENVHVRGIRQNGIRIRNAVGESGRPITLERCRIQLIATTDAGIALGGELDTKHVVIRNNRIEGPGRAGIRFDGAALDIEAVGNRFYNLESGFAFARVPDGKPMSVKITSNTGYDIRKGGIDFDFQPAQSKGKLEIAVSKNYFARTPHFAHAGGSGGAIAGVAFTDNGFAKDSGAGNVPSGAVKLDAPALPNPNPADDATFLKFPAGSPEPIVGTNKVRVGAN